MGSRFLLPRRKLGFFFCKFFLRGLLFTSGEISFWAASLNWRWLYLIHLLSANEKRRASDCSLTFLLSFSRLIWHPRQCQLWNQPVWTEDLSSFDCIWCCSDDPFGWAPADILFGNQFRLFGLEYLSPLQLACILLIAPPTYPIYIYISRGEICKPGKLLLSIRELLPVLSRCWTDMLAYVLERGIDPI